LIKGSLLSKKKNSFVQIVCTVTHTKKKKKKKKFDNKVSFIRNRRNYVKQIETSICLIIFKSCRQWNLYSVMKQAYPSMRAKNSVKFQTNKHSFDKHTTIPSNSNLKFTHVLCVLLCKIFIWIHFVEVAWYKSNLLSDHNLRIHTLYIFNPSIE